MQLGVCYYPEHWPQAWWADDARRMADMGLSYVRIGEFAWSRLEPAPGAHDWTWLDDAIATLCAAGLRIVLATPTATPPKWLIDSSPDILPVDRRGRPRRFGSRRHYCFSSATYRAHASRIVEELARRYGTHPGVAAWQTDNEYGCHDTVLSYSAAARDAFRDWLARRYQSIDALNRAWGCVFWSQEYRSFDEVDPPVETVTEANPSHRLDYQRFASDQVVQFNRLQTDIIRRHSPGRPVLHNFMGMFTDFDHFAVGRDLDAASWDSYPLGFLEQAWWPPADKARYLRQGHPDFTAFHHDLYRGVGRGRWWVMEQQPGPVNWASYNPAPAPGMVRAWTWEAFAHGAEVVSYFRWRQAPFAQEQMHAGLQRPDRTEAPAAAEAREVAGELKAIGPLAGARGDVALVFDYQAQWMLDIQPQGACFNYLELALAFYAAARRLGLDVDVVPAQADLSGYAAVLAPSLPALTPDALAVLEASGAPVIFGPRSGSKTQDFQIPAELAPGPLRRLLPLTVTRVESLRPGWREPAGPFSVGRWLEHVETDLPALARTGSGHGIWFEAGRFTYLAAWPCPDLLDAVLRPLVRAAGLDPLDLPADLRVRRRGGLRFAFNFGPDTIDLARHALVSDTTRFRIGARHVASAGVAAWEA